MDVGLGPQYLAWQLIQDVPIDWGVDWASRHLNVLDENYRAAPWYAEVVKEFAGILARRPARLSELNVALISWVAGRCGIHTPLVDAGSLPSRGRKTERLLSLVQAVGGTTYLSGPSAETYLDLAEFERTGIALEYKSYDYEPYQQLWGAFEGAVSILDLLMNTGPQARHFMKSRTPNRVAVG